jgi:hypothetical protein
VALFAAVGGAAIAAKKKGLEKNSVVTKSIKNNAVTGPKVGPGAITSPKIADGSILGVDIANGTITAGKLANGVLAGAPRRLTGVMSGATQTRSLTVGNWTVNLNTNSAGICASISFTAGPKPGTAAVLTTSAAVAAGATTTPQAIAQGGGIPVGAAADDGTSSFNGLATFFPVGGNSCVFDITMTGS